jgi:hypothetical protein
MNFVKEKELNKEGCEFCINVLGGDEAHPDFHCGLDYFMKHPSERKVVKLVEYPKVSPQHHCDHWVHK